MFFGKKPHEEFDLTDTKPGSSTTDNAEGWEKSIKTPEPGPSIDTKNALKDLKEQLKTAGQEKPSQTVRYRHRQSAVLA